MSPLPHSPESHTPANGLQLVVAGVVACLVFAIMQGVHDNYGIMLQPLVEKTGNSYARVSFSIGVGAFLYGLLPPFFGLAALRKSNAFVMLCGVLMMASGLVLTSLCRPFPLFLAIFGILLPAGTAALGFAIIMGAVTPILGEKRAAAFSGILQASAGIGDALMAPALQGLISAKGIHFALTNFSLLSLLTIPAILWLGARNRNHTTKKNTSEQGTKSLKDLTLKEILCNAFRVPAYRWILIGFATCGFNMSIIESHLFSQFTSEGIPEGRASLIMTVYGLCTMAGAMLTGFLGLKFQMKNVLGTTYAARIVISLAFLVAAAKHCITLPFALATTAMLGLSGDATVPPTNGIILRHFGSEQLPILYGFALFGHQIGAFASASLGGLFVSSGWGYSPLWMLNFVLAAVAAAASYAIRPLPTNGTTEISS